LYAVQPAPLDEGVDIMSLVRKITHSRRSANGRRALARAVATAPTQASRDELLLLQRIGR
jgi:hypothetical protein